MSDVLHIDLSLTDAEILIAALMFAEGSALESNPSMVEALNVLRPWRSELLRTYIAKMAGREIPDPDSLT